MDVVPIIILLSGIIFITPDIFMLQFHTFQALLTVGGISIFTIFTLITNKRLSITINIITSIAISIICIILYNKEAITDISALFLIISATILIFDNIKISKNYIMLYNALAAIASLQILYGFGQYFNFIESYSSFNISGTFDNPAGYAICLSMLFPFILYKDVHWKIWHWKGIATCLSIVIVLLSGSRTGIISMFITVLIWLYRDTNIFNFYNSINKVKRVVILSTVILAVIIPLYFYKLDSANGRLLIWKISTDMIYDSPILGSGIGSFSSDYMLAQAEYFHNDPNSRYSILADNVKFAFNEYIMILVEYGVIGLFLLIGYLLLIKNKYTLNEARYKSAAWQSITSFIVISFFSYPLNYPFVWLLLAISIGIVSEGQKKLFNIPIILRPVLVIIIGLFVLFPIYQKWVNEREWHVIANLSLAGKTKEMLPRYRELHKNMYNNGLFLYNYGAELARIREFSKSNDILLECEYYFNDANVQLLIANNYIQLKEYNNAEKRLIMAHDMIPSKFGTLYQLMMLYDSTDQADKATEIASQIVKKRIKIYSETISHIKSIARKIITKYNSS